MPPERRGRPFVAVWGPGLLLRLPGRCGCPLVAVYAPERRGRPFVAVWGPGPPLRPPCRRRCLGRVRRRSPVTQGRRCQRHRPVSDHHQRRLSAMITRINIFSPITNRMRAPQGLARPLELIGLVSKNKLIL